MQDLFWPIILGLGSTGILMALLSSLVGMRQKVEMPTWWGLYAIWVVVDPEASHQADARWTGSRQDRLGESGSGELLRSHLIVSERPLPPGLVRLPQHWTTWQ